MSYQKRLIHAFQNAPILPITTHTKYVFFSDCHRGSGNNNDNFLKNENSYFAALQYYYQNNFCYIEVGDGDELWENKTLNEICEIHNNIFSLLQCFQNIGHFYMLYGNHDMEKKHLPPLWDCASVYEGLILKANTSTPIPDLYVTHGHQADFLNSTLWKLARFLVRYLWSPLEYFGLTDPTSAAKNNTKRKKIEKRLIHFTKSQNCLLLAGHTHRPTLGSYHSCYFNCGSCVHPKGITCIELCGFQMNLIKWYSCTEKSNHFGTLYHYYPPTFPVYIKREVLATKSLI